MRKSLQSREASGRPRRGPREAERQGRETEVGSAGSRVNSASPALWPQATPSPSPPSLSVCEMGEMQGLLDLSCSDNPGSILKSLSTEAFIGKSSSWTMMLIYRDTKECFHLSPPPSNKSPGRQAAPPFSPGKGLCLAGTWVILEHKVCLCLWPLSEIGGRGFSGGAGDNSARSSIY